MPENRDGAGADRLTVTAAADGDACVITVSGEIDHDTGTPLREALLDATIAETPHVLVDFSDVTFLDSSGLNILLSAHRNATDAGGWLRLAGTNANVLRILQIVGVDTIIGLYPTVPAALA
ncbi:STAS domain-containing protein [Streptomyces sp. NPDC006552]|uniref:STAS domain-containing protein n=1 Tax=Streptomyces sp. NPDC006552 TaxID=3157179 RepID=UPI00339F8C9C